MGNIIYIAGRNQPTSLLLVERDPLARTAVAAHLREAGLSVIEAVNSAEMLSLLRAGRPISVVFGTLKPATVALVGREFPQVKLLLGQEDSSPVSRHGPPSVRRPYDLRTVEKVLKSLMPRSKIRR
jgi:CheY-like chemotaxis protein